LIFLCSGPPVGDPREYPPLRDAVRGALDHLNLGELDVGPVGDRHPLRICLKAVDKRFIDRRLELKLIGGHARTLRRTGSRVEAL
jgi:hypothetical protein